MSEKINKLVDAKLDDYFDGYLYSQDLRELKDEIASDLIASAEDKVAEGMTEQQAVEQAFKDFGDIDMAIDDVLDNLDDEPHEQQAKHASSWGHHIDIDDNGIRVDKGKVLNINDDGITVNNGKTIKIDEDGVKLGNMVIDSDGIKFGGKTKKNVVNFKDLDDLDVDFDDNFDTTVNVESLPMTDMAEFDLDEINNLDISYINASLKVLATSGDKVVVKEYMSRKNPEYQVKTDIDGNTLKIIQGKVPHFLPLKIKVQILVPKTFAGNLRVLNQSGSLQIRDFKFLNDAQIDVHSGMIYLDNVHMNQLLLNTTSGKVTLEDLKVKKNLNLQAKSSVVNLSDVASPNFQYVVKSGTIRGYDLVGAGKISAKSGTIKANFAKVSGDISCDSNSGRIKLQMPEDDSYNFDLEAQSGTVKMEVPANYKHDILSLKEGTVGNDPQYNLRVRAKSGTIKVEAD